MMGHKTPEKTEDLIPMEAIKRSIEVRNPIETGKPRKNSKDPFSEDRMARNEPPTETVLHDKPDDTVLPG